MRHGEQEGGTLVEGSGRLGVGCGVQEIINNKQHCKSQDLDQV